MYNNKITKYIIMDLLFVGDEVDHPRVAAGCFAKKVVIAVNDC